MNSLFVVSMGFGLAILAVAIGYLIYLKRQNKDHRLSQEMGMYPAYEADDGPLSNTQMQAIRDAVPQNNITVISSLFGGTSVSDDFMGERGAQKQVEREDF